MSTLSRAACCSRGCAYCSNSQMCAHGAELCPITDVDDCVDDQYAYAHCAVQISQSACCGAGCSYCTSYPYIDYVCLPNGACRNNDDACNLPSCGARSPSLSASACCMVVGCTYCNGMCSNNRFCGSSDECAAKNTASVCSQQSTLSACCSQGCVNCATGLCAQTAASCASGVTACPNST
jgi:hypothetical protein